MLSGYGYGGEYAWPELEFVEEFVPFSGDVVFEGMVVFDGIMVLLYGNDELVGLADEKAVELTISVAILDEAVAFCTAEAIVDDTDEVALWIALVLASKGVMVTAVSFAAKIPGPVFPQAKCASTTTRDVIRSMITPSLSSHSCVTIRSELESPASQPCAADGS